MSMIVRAALLFFAAGILLFLVNYYLIIYHTRKATLEGKKLKKNKADHFWGKNGREGIVPKWVSYIGLMAFVSFFMGIFMLGLRVFWNLFS
ncbi:MAG: hypothetical protein JJE29_06390 [Peptostreptococcaceae bacterium]|nr:hypothetical protein [Peptostreptococcaceae bacterium]